MITRRDIDVAIAQPKPLIAPGTYLAVSTDVDQDRFRWGQKLRIRFTVFAGDPLTEGGEVLATGLEWYANLKAGVNGSSSKVTRLFRLLPAVGNSVSTALLRDQLWRVEVETVSQDAEDKAIPPYSIVAHVSEYLGAADSSSR